MTTLKDAIKAKHQLEDDILKLVQTYEREYSLSVSSLYNHTHLVLGDKQEKTFKVEVKVEV